GKYCFSAFSTFTLMNVARSVPVPKSRTSLILPLCDFRVGVLPNQRLHLMHKIVSELRQSNWSGFQAFGPAVGDLDPVVQYLVRASFDATATPDNVCHGLFDTLCGSPDVTARLIKGFEHIGQ